MARRIDFEKELDSNQLAAVKSTKRFTRIIAGAGSGKTTALTYRFAYLVQKLNVDDSRILCVTFTNKATAEMKGRIDRLLGINTSTVMTFNALGYKILRTEKTCLGWHEDCTVIDEDTDLIRIVKEILERSPIDDPVVSINHVVKHIMYNKMGTDYLPYLKPDDQQAEIMMAGALEEKNVEEYIYYAYLAYQRKYSMVDFTDQVRIPLLLFEQYPEVLERWSKKYHYILVDEFQDVSDLNYRLCEALAGKENHLFVVGDPDQVIYTWRDAVPDYLINFDKTHKMTASINMMTNYRSTKEIVDGANNVIRNNIASHDKYLKMIPSNTGTADKISYYRAHDAQEEAMAVVGMIRGLIEQGIDGNRIAILFRTHDSALVIRQKLKLAGIPYTEMDEERAAKVLPVIQDLISTFRFIIDPGDKNFDDLPPDIFDPLLALEPDEPMEGVTKFEHAKRIANEKPEENKEAAKLIKVIDEVRSNCDDARIGAEPLVKIVLDQCGFTDYFNKSPIEEERVAWIRLAEEVLSFKTEDDKKLTFREFVFYIDEKVSITPDKTEKAVRLMTIHAAKGLEFDYVFVIHMIDHIMPIHNKKFTTLRNLEEERRIAYVAFTRAKIRLWLCDYTAGSDSQGVEGQELPAFDDAEPEQFDSGEGEESKDDDFLVKPQPSHYIVELGVGADRLDQMSQPLTPRDIESINQLYRQTNSSARIKTRAHLKQFTLLTNVIHVLYGRGMIIRIESGGALIVRFQNYDEPLKITDATKLELDPDEEDDFIPDDEDFLDCSEKESDSPSTKQFKKVQKLINDTYHDPDHASQVSVLPLPCGTGKSSAVSRLICQTIAAYKAGSKRGLLILANNLIQLTDYLAPNDINARQYIKHHMDYIVQIDSDNKTDVEKYIAKRPVVIISTQRYFSIDPYMIESEYLTFGKEADCIRDLILVDEEPAVYECCVYHQKSLELIDKAVTKVFAVSDDNAEQTDDEQEEQADAAEPLWTEDGEILCSTNKFCLEYWQQLKQYISQKIDELRQQALEHDKSNYYAYLTPGEIIDSIGVTFYPLSRVFE